MHINGGFWLVRRVCRDGVVEYFCGTKIRIIIVILLWLMVMRDFVLFERI